MVSRLVGLLLLVAGSGLGQFFIQEGGLSGAFLNYGPAPRSLALGKSFVAVADDAQAGYYNPGGLHQLNAHEVMVAHSQLFGARMEFVGYSVPTRTYGTFGFTLLNLGAEGVLSRGPQNEAYSAYAFAENAYVVSYANSPWHFIGFGASAKIITKNLALFSAVGFGADLGVHVRALPELSLGLQIQNLIQPRLQLRSLPELYPRTVRVGSALQLLDGRATITADAVVPVVFERDSLNNPTRRFSPGVAPHGGVEFELVRGVLIQRAGLDLNDISVGLGVHRDWGRMGIGVDYAFLLHYRSDYRMPPTHKVGVFVDFAGFRVWIDAQPAVFAPLPDNMSNVLWMDTRIMTRAPVKRWQLLIRNSLGEIVRTYSGWEAPPLRLSWDGLDDVGRLVADGRYSYQIVVVDENNRSYDFDGPLTTVRTKGPAGRLEVITPGD